MKKRVLATVLAMSMVLGLVACGSKSDSKDDKKEETKTEAKADDAEDVELQVFIAASLSKVMDEVATEYQKDHPNVKITFNADSSGTLLTQIEEGYACDVFFSAAQKQMDQLEKDGLVVDGTRANVVNNQVVVVSLKDSGTKVTGLENLNEASSIALAGGSVGGIEPLQRFAGGAAVAGLEQGGHAALAAVHIAALAQFGASCRVHRGAEGVHPVKALSLQGADVIAEQGEHQCFLGL